MGYEPAPAPELSPLEDRHQLQRHAHSIGYVAVPEGVWDELFYALHGTGTPHPTCIACWCLDGYIGEHTSFCFRAQVALKAARETYDRIRQERE